MQRLFLFAVYLFACEIDLGNSADELEFWTRYPERRSLSNSKFSKPSENTETHFHYGRVKGSTAKKENKRITPKGKNVTKHEKKSTESKTDHPALRNRIQEPSDDKESWPRVQRNRFKKKGREGEDVRTLGFAAHKETLWPEHRSTRMTPLYLLQQEETTTVATDNISQNQLNFYDIKNDILAISRAFAEANISVEVIGRTAEYKDIVLMKVAERKSEIGKYFRADESKYIDEVPEKKIIFIVHALSVMGMNRVPCFVMEQEFKELLSYYFAHLDKFDIFIIPLANPDGAKHKKEYGDHIEVWNKNMSPQAACSGVALDRNFDVAWNHSHSISPCSQLYPGSTPFSEPETRAIREVLHQYSHKIIAYFHVHAGTFSYLNFKGDAVLYPKGYTDVQADDDKYIDLRGEIDEAMKNASFQVLSVTVDTLYNWYGTIRGSSVDYAASIFGVPYAMELVMQPYEDNIASSAEFSKYALKEIWKRIIDVIFNHIYHNVKNNEL